MKSELNVFLVILPLYFPFLGVAASNLTCYQCTRNTNTECGPDDLRPCPHVSDRCVTTVIKNADKKFTIKRECGLGPCQFDDAMVNRGLGLDKCDRTRDEYFCVICCRESGCNRSQAISMMPFNFELLITSFILCRLIIK